MTYIYAHRGSSSTHPENTLEAFIAAKQAGADGIELDVHLTKDGEVVVIHDVTVDRTTNGSGFVEDYTLKQLSKLKVSQHYKYFFVRTAHIPTLRTVFEWLQGNQLRCNVELKNSVKRYEGLEDKVIDLIRKFNLEKRTILSSFNHRSLKYCYALAPDIEIAPLYKRVVDRPWEYAKSMNAHAIHPNLKSISTLQIEEAMAEGIAVRPYTVNKTRDMKRLFLLNCSAIITDFPAKAYELREKICL